jgi:hypothetical protein
MSLKVSKRSSMGLKAVYQHIVDNILAVVTTSCLVALVRLGPAELISWLCELPPAHLLLVGFVSAAAATVYLMLRPCTVYLIDYACFHSSSNRPLARIPMASFVEHTKHTPTIELINWTYLEYVAFCHYLDVELSACTFHGVVSTPFHGAHAQQVVRGTT